MWDVELKIWDYVLIYCLYCLSQPIIQSTWMHPFQIALMSQIHQNRYIYIYIYIYIYDDDDDDDSELFLWNG